MFNHGDQLQFTGQFLPGFTPGNLYEVVNANHRQFTLLDDVHCPRVFDQSFGRHLFTLVMPTALQVLEEEGGTIRFETNEDRSRALRCTCGCASVGGPRHSTWCDLETGVASA